MTFAAYVSIPLYLHRKYRGNMSSGFSGNSEVKASEILENLEEMFFVTGS